MKNELFKNLTDYDIIDDTQIQAEIMQRKREELLKKHPWDVWERNGTYYVYLRDDSKPNGRRQIQRQTKKEIINEIIKNVDEFESIKIKDLFEEFIERKEVNDNIKPSTVYRYRLVFKRHYEATGWDKKDIRKISIDEYADYIEDEIGRNSLTAKGLSSLKLITTGILKRAAKKHLIDYTYNMVYDFVDVRPKKRYRDLEKEVITEAELHAFIRYVKENMDVMNLSLLFMLLSGLRVGEMTTLKFKDFITKTSFKVCRTETFYKDKNGKMIYAVGDDTKTEAGRRTAFIPKQYEWVTKELRKLNPFTEFVCTDKNGDRIRSYKLRSRLYYICKKLPEFHQLKSPHKLRKTFCSILLDQGFDNNFITSVMGHTDISVSENFYHFDRKSLDKKQSMIDEVKEFKII